MFKTDHMWSNIHTNPIGKRKYKSEKQEDSKSEYRKI